MPLFSFVFFYIFAYVLHILGVLVPLLGFRWLGSAARCIMLAVLHQNQPHFACCHPLQCIGTMNKPNY